MAYNGGWRQGNDGLRHYDDGSVGGGQGYGYLTAMRDYGTSNPQQMALQDEQNLRYDQAGMDFRRKGYLADILTAEEEKNQRLETHR